MSGVKTMIERDIVSFAVSFKRKSKAKTLTDDSSCCEVTRDESIHAGPQFQRHLIFSLLRICDTLILNTKWQTNFATVGVLAGMNKLGFLEPCSLGNC